MVRDRDVAARVLNTASTVAGESQTVGLRAAIEGKTGQLRPGEFVTVDLPLATTQDGWTVPLAAVAHDGNQAYVFVRTADGFDVRPVNVAASAGQSVRIQGALKAGDTIAVAGVVALKGAWFKARESK